MNTSRIYVAGAGALRLLSVSAAIALAACGGGGGDAPSAAAPGTPPPAEAAPTLEVSCTDCGATSATQFTPGGKAGVWTLENTSEQPVTLPLAISGLAGANATFALTNLGSTDKTLPDNGMFTQAESKLPAKFDRAASTQEAAQSPRQRDITEFNLKGFAKVLERPATSVPRFEQRQAAMRPDFYSAPVGTPHNWIDCQSYDNNFNCLDANPYRETTLQAKGTSPSGRVVNIWVENTEFASNKISSEFITNMLNQLVKPNGVVESLRTLGGTAWGAHAYEGQVIPGANQPLNIVLANLSPNGQPYGVMGYFWAVNNFTHAYVPMSNEALVTFLDTETGYLAGSGGAQALMSTLVHEGTHLTNFFRRSVAGGLTPYETWLEEFTAMAAEDIAGYNIDPSYNNVRDDRLPFFLIGDSFNCNLTNFQVDAPKCFGYSVVGSFGGYLVRQLGVPFYKNVLASNAPNSVQMLDDAIKAYRPTSSLNKELAAFAGVTASMTPTSQLPTGAGFPALASEGFNLPGIDLATQRGYWAPSSQPPTKLSAYGTIAWNRYNVADKLEETVTLPPGTKLTLTVVNRAVK